MVNQMTRGVVNRNLFHPSSGKPAGAGATYGLMQDTGRTARSVEGVTYPILPGKG